MKRAGMGLLYLVGALSIGYLALFAYTMLRGDASPDTPLRIFRKDDAPRYSWWSSSQALGSEHGALREGKKDQAPTATR